MLYFPAHERMRTVDLLTGWVQAGQVVEKEGEERGQLPWKILKMVMFLVAITDWCRTGGADNLEMRNWVQTLKIIPSSFRKKKRKKKNYLNPGVLIFVAASVMNTTHFHLGMGLMSLTASSGVIIL